MTCFIVGIISFPFSLSGVADYMQYSPAKTKPPLCAAVGFSEITSANVVGYLNKEVRKNLSQQVCTFDQIGVKDGALDIQKLLPVDEEGEYIGDGDITIQFISDRGKIIQQYSYYGDEELEDDDGKLLNAGWWDDENFIYADYVFGSCEAFQVSGGAASTFQYSGEVLMAETDVPFRKNLSFQANVRPCVTDIQSIIPVDDDGNYIGNGDITIQFFSDRGKLLQQYSYYGDEELEDDDGKLLKAGWWNDEEFIYADYEFAAGEGFKLSAGQAGFLRFPEL